VNPLPTPTDPGVDVVNVVYEYDINSNIPAYIWNVPAMANSLMAYFERRLNQDSLDLPVDADGQVRDCDAGCAARLDSGETITRLMNDGETVRITRVADTTYGGYQSNGLPLVAPLRLLGDPGNVLADAATPALRAVVDYGYPDNDPLGAPQDYIPARLVPRPQETATFLHQLADGLRQGVQILEGRAALGDSAAKTVEMTSAATTNTANTDDDVEAAPPVTTKPFRSQARSHLRDNTPVTRVAAPNDRSGERPHPIVKAAGAHLDKLVKRIADGPRPHRHGAKHQ
jgi:PE-PPE domain